MLNQHTTPDHWKMSNDRKVIAPSQSLVMYLVATQLRPRAQPANKSTMQSDYIRISETATRFDPCGDIRQSVHQMIRFKTLNNSQVLNF